MNGKPALSYTVGDLKHLEKAALEARSRIEAWQQRSKPAEKRRVIRACSHSALSMHYSGDLGDCKTKNG